VRVFFKEKFPVSKKMFATIIDLKYFKFMNICKKQKKLLFILYIILLSAPLTIIACYTHHRPVPSYTICDISYGPDKENTMDISLPEGRTGATPVIILVHGGAWTGGDKSDLSFLRGYFFKKGFASFSVNYRLARIEGTGLRNILDDIDSIISFVKEKSGFWTYSRDVIFLAGHSAGAHIALLYSFSRAPEGAIRGLVSFCGLADLIDPELEKFLSRMHENEKIPLFAKKPFDRIGFIAGPDIKMRIACSPQFITRDISVLLFCGKMDDLIPWTQSENLHKKMKERGFDSTLYVYPAMGHDITPYYGKIMKITEKWIRNRM
jgi:acetyl esterase/lipase